MKATRKIVLYFLALTVLSIKRKRTNPCEEISTIPYPYSLYFSCKAVSVVCDILPCDSDDSSRIVNTYHKFRFNIIDSSCVWEKGGFSFAQDKIKCKMWFFWQLTYFVLALIFLENCLLKLIYRLILQLIFSIKLGNLL